MASQGSESISPPKLPRVAITYCTQCKWMLRAAYFGQELLSTFGTSIGEIALIPATGGLFTVVLIYEPPTSDSQPVKAQEVLVWDRKREGGFPETKILKQRIRNYIEPEKKLGHSDTPSSKSNSVIKQEEPTAAAKSAQDPTQAQKCEDCS